MNGRILKLNDGKTDTVLSLSRGIEDQMLLRNLVTLSCLAPICVLQFLLGIWASYLIPC